MLTLDLAPLLLIVSGSFVVGVLGGALGVGGGVFLVPFLSIVVGLRPVEAVGVSLFCVIGASASAASISLRNGEANLGLSLVLEPALLVGAVIASVVAQRLSDVALMLSFAVLLAGVALLFVWQAAANRAWAAITPDRPAHIVDGVSGGVLYRPQRLPLVVGSSVFAGAAAGLFGIGGGLVVVPMLAQLARVPMRAAAATSSLSLMVTAGAAGAVHFAHDTVPPSAVAAAMLGVLPGGAIGARLQQRLPERAMRAAFASIALAVAGMLLWRARHP